MWNQWINVEWINKLIKLLLVESLHYWATSHTSDNVCTVPAHMNKTRFSHKDTESGKFSRNQHSAYWQSACLKHTITHFKPALHLSAELSPFTKRQSRMSPTSGGASTLDTSVSFFPPQVQIQKRSLFLESPAQIGGSFPHSTRWNLTAE